MTKKTMCFVAFIVTLFALGTAAAQDSQVLSLTLEDCIAKALKNNLSVAIELLNPELADIQLSKAKEIFMPRLDLSYGANRQANPSYWFLQGSGTSISNLATYGVSIVETIPTGGTVGVSLQSYRSETNQAFQLINPRFGSTLQFNITQPLLRNFGPKVARRAVLQAENNLDIAQLQLRNTMLETIYFVQEGYWNLFYAIENTSVKRNSLLLARDLLAKNRKEVEFGQLAPIEILNAESVVAQREADLIQAEGLISRSEELLKSLINLAAEGDARLKKLIPSDKLGFAESRLTLDQAMKEALERRPELKILQKSLETKDLNLSVAKNQMLPSLDFQLSYSSPGISGDRILYQDENPFLGIIVGKQKGSSTDALRDAFRLLYNNWNVGLTLSIPLSTLLTKADLAYARMDYAQSQVRIKNLEQQIALEVSDAIRTLETNAKRVNALRVSRELAEKSLDAEEKKLKVGLSTNYFVLEFQDRLANARSAEIRAQIDYILAVERLERAMGVSLDKRNFKIVQ